MEAYYFLEVLVVVFQCAISKQVFEALVGLEFIDVCAEEDINKPSEPQKEEVDVKDHDCAEEDQHG